VSYKEGSQGTLFYNEGSGANVYSSTTTESSTSDQMCLLFGLCSSPSPAPPKAKPVPPIAVPPPPPAPEPKP